MIHTAESFALVVAGIIIVAIVVYAAWHGERWFNWKYGYGSKTSKEITIQVEPVNARVRRLEKRVKKLEKLEDRIYELERKK